MLARIYDEEGMPIPAYVFIDKVIEMGLVSRLDGLVLDRLVSKAEEMAQACQRLFINVAAGVFPPPQLAQSTGHPRATGTV